MIRPLRVKRGVYLLADDDDWIERLSASIGMRRSAILDEALHREIVRLRRRESRWRKPRVKRQQEERP